MGLNRSLKGYLLKTPVVTVGNKLLVSGECELDGTLNHDGALVGFYSAVPVAKPTALTAINNGVGDLVWGQTELDVLNNSRTRAQEIEQKQQALGLLT